jgi:hypothetical protein
MPSGSSTLGLRGLSNGREGGAAGDDVGVQFQVQQGGLV